MIVGSNENATKSRILMDLRNDFYTLTDFSKISLDLTIAFKEFINKLKSKNILLDFYFIPINPLIFPEFQKKYPLVLEAEILIRKFAYENKIKCLGNYNPSFLNLDESNFYDGYHLNSSGKSKFMNYLR